MTTMNNVILQYTYSDVYLAYKYVFYSFGITLIMLGLMHRQVANNVDIQQRTKLLSIVSD